ncbi:hypothetical protein B0H14DRAFT_3150031 [Mycena olivaceomarginata]|nr:hypothetical protein B0H14DRAFT_3150031 [Mycena olivaceomarginata]
MLNKGRGTQRATSSSRQEQEKKQETDRLRQLTKEQAAARSRLHDVPDFDDPAPYNDPLAYILDGTIRADISHAGGDLNAKSAEEEEEQLWEELRESHWYVCDHKIFWVTKVSIELCMLVCTEYCTRRDRTTRLFDAFDPQMEAIASAYMDWDLASSKEGLGTPLPPREDAMVQSTLSLIVVHIISTYRAEIPMLAGDAFITSGLVQRGFFPCSPSEPSIVITTRTLEIFRVATLRCPRFAIQPFVCDLHSVPFRPYLFTQFSIAFDVYLAARLIIEGRVKVTLRRDAPNWCLKNACPACLYKLEDEPPLELPFLSTKDDNNSLKHFEKLERHVGDAVPGPSKERDENRKTPGDYILEREVMLPQTPTQIG